MSLYNFLVLLQLNQGSGSGGGTEAAPAATGAAETAAEGAKQASGGLFGGGMLDLVVWMVFFFALMYFLLIRPQKKQRQKHESLLGSLTKGDKVVTTGGIMGTIRGITSVAVTLEVSEKVTIRVRKEHIAGLQLDPKEEGPAKS